MTYQSKVQYFFLLIFFCQSEQRVIENCNENKLNEADLGITISPIMRKELMREIEIYWMNLNLNESDSLVLFKGNPNDSNSEILFKMTLKQSHGFKKTGIGADYIPTSNLTFREQCLKYYVSWMKNNVHKKTNCLSTHPNWMKERKDVLGKLKMREIFIPGTHDSAAYKNYANFQKEYIVDKYTITQDEDILGQLIYGARYLDIRVGRYQTDDIRFWGNHGPIRIVPLQVVINAVKYFLDNTEEIVIFDVQEFPTGFKSLEDHHELMDFLEKEFAGYYLERPANVWKVNLEEIWELERRLIISYDNSNIVGSRLSVWPQVDQQWGNVRNPFALYKYLNKVETEAADEAFFSNRLTQPRAAMAQMTPNTFDIIFDKFGGLRKMAENVDINVTEWYNEEWHRTANVVAVDFIKATGIVQTALKWNDFRATEC